MSVRRVRARSPLCSMSAFSACARGISSSWTCGRKCRGKVRWSVFYSTHDELDVVSFERRRVLGWFRRVAVEDPTWSKRLLELGL